MPELLPREYVGEVNFDYRQRNSSYSVPQGHRGVRICCRVEDHATKTCLRSFLQPVDQLTLMVALPALHAHAQFPGPVAALLLQLTKGEPAVYVGLTAAKQVQVRSVQNEDHYETSRSCSQAVRSSPAARSSTMMGSLGARMSTKRSSRPTTFLSRAM